MNPTRPIRAIVVALAVVVLGCGQSAASPTGGAGPTTAAPATSQSKSSASIAAPSKEAPTPEEPVEFTGRLVCGPPVRSATEETLEVGKDGVVLTRNRAGAWQQTVTMSDPRLGGTVFHTFEGDTYRTAGAEIGPEMWAATHRIENEQGAWEDRGYGGNFSDGTPIGENAPTVWIGEGAYEGMIAIMESTPFESGCGVDVRGVIFDGVAVAEPYRSG